MDASCSHWRNNADSLGSPVGPGDSVIWDMEKTEITQDIWDLFHPVEGQNTVYYGKIRNGKTRTATADILQLLKRGEIVYANWVIDFSGFDERDSLAVVFAKWIKGNVNYFKFLPENLHFIDPDELISGEGDLNIKYLSRLVNVHLFIDEGQWVLPSLDKSYDADAIAKMRLVLHGGHYCRSLNIITQRPTNISKTTRSQINVWYRCVKAWDAFGWILFKRYEIEDMKDDMPVEYEVYGVQEDRNWIMRFLFGEIQSRQVPMGQLKTYWAHKKTDPVFKAYDTHAMRAKDAIEEPVALEVYTMRRGQAFKHLASLVSARFPRRQGRKTPRRRGLWSQAVAFLFPFKDGRNKAALAVLGAPRPREGWGQLINKLRPGGRLDT